jgi:hypothetical protein
MQQRTVKYHAWTTVTITTNNFYVRHYSVCQIWGFHGGEDDDVLLGFAAV